MANVTAESIKPTAKETLTYTELNIIVSSLNEVAYIIQNDEVTDAISDVINILVYLHFSSF